MDILSIPITDLENDDYLLNYGLRSINIVLFIKSLEQKFGFEFSDDDMILNNFKSINEIERLVKKYMK
ncbi:Phosphopantetheine attachment site [Anaerosporobacter mobilis DSM 15930]|uniref:Phosphopantetheine attachment site n=2 Tax=Anaerosporobacter TaxID=653683 RepID=A0A1M7I8R6_9FIRM|nr:Phosphopantetheine attachment site [Anaerosporobacter mobilis DSM 15930]